ncbi:MAG: hypothetical protein CW336_02505 [Bacteroidetes bacterium]|nr:hypothetical protein [Bacteroidota bacterium]
MKAKTNQIWLNIISIILGCIFLLSGFGKLAGVDAFESLIESYGFPHLAFLAPVVILMEVLLGLLLILNYRKKTMGIISGIMLIIFTVFYSYAYIAHGITDCGCFGNNPILKSSPIFSYIRNAIMIALFVILYIYGNNDNRHITKATICYLSAILIVCAFIMGRSFMIPSMFVKPHPLFMKPVVETKIPHYVDLSNDSTYVVYVFSYDCAGCWNNMTNFMNYDSDSIADRSIGLCVGGKGRNTFINYFKPNFDIYDVGTGLYDEIKIVPTFLYIKNGLIHDIIQGSVVNPKLFKDNYLNSNN